MSGPWRWIGRLPLVESAAPARLTMVVAVLLAMAACRLVGTRTPPAGPRTASVGLLLAGMIAVLLPLTPTPLTVATRPPVPGVFTGDDWTRFIRPGHTLVAARHPDIAYAEPMRWQAATGFAFRINGGYVIRPGEDGRMRHSYSGQRAATAGTGAVLGAVLAAGTVYLGFLDADLLAATLAVWLLGWMLGPVFMGGGDETLRPEYFTMLGLSPRRLATGLLTASFVGVAPLVSLGALVGLVVAGARLGPVNALVALPAMALQLAVFVLLSKVSVAVVGLALRTRAGAVFSGLMNGVLLASLGQIWVFMVAFGQTGTPTVVRYLPSGWGLLAVRGQWWALVALAALVLVLLGLWAALLSRRIGRPRASGRGRRPIARPPRPATSSPRNCGPGRATSCATTSWRSRSPTACGSRRAR